MKSRRCKRCPLPLARPADVASTALAYLGWEARGAFEKLGAAEFSLSSVVYAAVGLCEVCGRSAFVGTLTALQLLGGRS